MKTVIFKEDMKFDEPVNACIGYFDAMHRGHRKLIDLCVLSAKKSQLKSALICFDPDPVDIITNHKTDHLFSLKERKNLINDAGIDEMIIIHFDEEVMKTDPLVFIERYLNRMNIKELFCGFDYSFGYMGKGNSDLLKAHGDFITTVLPEYSCYGRKISSTRIKQEISKGNFKLVNRLLGFNYYQIVKVINVSQRGSKQLIQAVQAEKHIIRPAQGEFDNFSYKDDVFVFESEQRLRPGDLYKLCL